MYEIINETNIPSWDSQDDFILKVFVEILLITISGFFYNGKEVIPSGL